MKRFAPALLLLFVASLLGSAIAETCMAASQSQPGVAMQALPCCAMKVGCIGGTCTSAIQQVGCTAETGWFAVARKDEVAGLAKLVLPLVVAIPSLTRVAHARPPPLPVPVRNQAEIVSYGDVYARTGRLLI